MEQMANLVYEKAKEVKETFANEDLNTMIGVYMAYIMLALLLMIIVSFGAAKLSYCYNIYMGSSEGVAFLWSLLSFFFSGFYYPFYALFLDPLCEESSVKSVSSNLRKSRKNR
jgi:riboflavin transporter FmnP